MDLLDRLLAHDVWTTRKLLEQARELTDEQLNSRFDIDNRSARECFEHIIENMEIWTDLMAGRTVADRSGNDITALIKRLEVVARDLAQLARKVGRENRWDDVFVDTLDQPPQIKTFGGGIGHLITHSMHHRAQIMLMFERLGKQEHIEGDLLTWESIAFGWQ